jgi:hypothetical protein
MVFAPRRLAAKEKAPSSVPVRIGHATPGCDAIQDLLSDIALRLCFAGRQVL